MGCGPGLLSKEEYHGVHGRVGGRNAGQCRFDKLQGGDVARTHQRSEAEAIIVRVIGER